MMRTAAETLELSRMYGVTLQLGMRPGSLIMDTFDDKLPRMLLHQQHLAVSARLRIVSLTVNGVIERSDAPESALARLLYDPGA
jgi:hypothetical protein